MRKSRELVSDESRVYSICIPLLADFNYTTHVLRTKKDPNLSFLPIYNNLRSNSRQKTSQAFRYELILLCSDGYYRGLFHKMKIFKLMFLKLAVLYGMDLMYRQYSTYNMVTKYNFLEIYGYLVAHW